MAERVDAVVIGGGIAGLVWADALATAGRTVTVVERARTLGGLVRAEPLGDLAVDVGAEAFAVARDEVLRLADGLGLDVVRPTGAPAHLARADGLVPLPPSLLGIPTSAAALTATLGAAEARSALERDARPPVGALPVTLGALVRERLGAAVADGLVAPVVAAVHAADVDDVELDAIAPRLADELVRSGSLVAAAARLRGDAGPSGAAVATVRAGMSALVAALARRIEAHGGTILVGQDVSAAERTAAGWTVRLAEHEREHEPEREREHERAPGHSVASTVTAGTLCLAVPAEVAARLLGANAPDATAVLDRIAAHGSADVTIVALLVADARLDTAPFGSGVLVTAERRDVGAKALTHTSAKWAHVRAALPDGHHVVRLSYGGTRALPAEDDAGLVTTAAADVGRLLPGGPAPVRPLDAVLAHWRSALPRPVVGRAALTRTLADVLATDPTLAIVGAAVGGNGLAGVVAQAHGEARRTLRTTEEDAG